MVSRTVASASTLLNTWIRILSQTEHNQRLILNPAWQGASQDVAELEHELMMRQQAEQRRELEEQQRREAAVRKADEEEAARRRAEHTGARGGGMRGTRGRSGSVGRGNSTGLRYPGSASQTTRGPGRGSSVPARNSSGIGRGIGGSRARGRSHLSDNG